MFHFEVGIVLLKMGSLCNGFDDGGFVSEPSIWALTQIYNVL